MPRCRTFGVEDVFTPRLAVGSNTRLERVKRIPVRVPPGNRAIKGTRLDPVPSDAPEPYAGFAVSVAQEQFDAKACSNCNHR